MRFAYREQQGSVREVLLRCCVAATHTVTHNSLTSRALHWSQRSHREIRWYVLLMSEESRLKHIHIYHAYILYVRFAYEERLLLGRCVYLGGLRVRSDGALDSRLLLEAFRLLRRNFSRNINLGFAKLQHRCAGGGTLADAVHTVRVDGACAVWRCLVLVCLSPHTHTHTKSLEERERERKRENVPVTTFTHTPTLATLCLWLCVSRVCR